MANLTAVFDMVDNMSAKLENIANVGNEVVNKWQSAGTAMDSSFTSAATAADGVASSTNNYSQAIADAMESAKMAADDLSTALENSTSIHNECCGDVKCGAGSRASSAKR